MSVWAATQRLIYELLVADAGVHAFVADRIYDGVPDDPVWPYISFGPSDVVEDDAECWEGQIETLQIDVWASDQSRSWRVKSICEAVQSALHEKDGTLVSGRLLMMRVGGMRVQPDPPDGIVAHGIVRVEIHTAKDGA